MQTIKFFIITLVLTTLNGCYILLGPANGGVEVPVYQVPIPAQYRVSPAPRVNRNGVQLGPSFTAQRRGYVAPRAVVVVPPPRPVITVVRPPEAQRQPPAKYKRGWKPGRAADGRPQPR